MRGRGIRLPFKLLGIPVILDYSFLLILPLFAYLIGSQLTGYARLLAEFGVEVDASRLESGVTPWALGLLGAVGLFSSVLVHELGHAVVARLYGVTVKEIRLWFLGGVAQFDEMPRGRGAEAVVAVVGPITSVLIGLLLWWVLPLARGNDGATLVLSYLAITNVILALFNLLPALPLDGGRVLRGVLSLFMPHLRATSVAATVSAVMAILLGLFGFFSMNFLLVVMAFFIYNAGRAEAQAAVLEDAFSGKSVADLMTTDPITVEPSMRASQFARMAHFLPHPGYPVVASTGELLGYARVADARALAGGVSAGEGSVTRLEEASAQADRISAGDAVVEAGAGEMGPSVAEFMRKPETIPATASAMDALRRLATGELGRLLVVDSSGRLVGVLGKSDLLSLLRQHPSA